MKEIKLYYIINVLIYRQYKMKESRNRSVVQIMQEFLPRGVTFLQQFRISCDQQVRVYVNSQLVDRSC